MHLVDLWRISLPEYCKYIRKCPKFKFILNDFSVIILNDSVMSAGILQFVYLLVDIACFLEFNHSSEILLFINLKTKQKTKNI